jgi:hypothetical protein
MSERSERITGLSVIEPHAAAEQTRESRERVTEQSEATA